MTTAMQKIKRHILAQAMLEPDLSGLFTSDPSDSAIDAQYELLVDADAHWDFEEEFRGSGEETTIPCPGSRNYESKSVARKLQDGSWVGWCYWYGGGKHGEPGAIPWMDEAYDLDVTETEKLVTVREFKKVGE